ncbi:hypothetical protein H6F32_19385 [Anabaena sp. FACHB-1237]|uniref:Tic20 family protein n=1 Tax=Anabaena sp. FACHB-1237 TaxID=2692769 RepID=UPI0016815F91|nr:Tic20 family protein [Anabaena sp. FACHB-1237]MBD2139666.1 hypothetical protein [Anabaena sp. FACHB-1237]
MTWRGSTTAKDRFFACLPYLLPLIEVFHFGQFLINDFPLLGIIFMPLLPLWKIYYGVRYAGLIIFLALWMLVVRNEQLSHFIRFNTMQAIILDIAIFLCDILISIVKLVPGSDFAIETLYTTVFLGIVGAVGYCVFQCVRGKYAEIPAISDAVYMQVR